MARSSVAPAANLEIEASPASEHRNGHSTGEPVVLHGAFPARAPYLELERLSSQVLWHRGGRLRVPSRQGLARQPLDQTSQNSAQESTEPRSRIGRNFGVLAGGQLVTWTMTLVWTLIVPRALGPVGYGLVVSAQSVSGVLTVLLGVGARNYLVREIVVERDRGAELVRTAIVLRLTLAPVVGLAAVIWARLAHYGYDASVVLYLVTAMAILTLLAEPLQAAFQATERMKYLAYGDVINKTQQSLVGIALVLVGFGAIGIAANMAATSVVVILIYAFWLRRFFRLNAKTSIRMMGTMTKQSIAYWVTWFFGFFYFWIDTIMLTLMTHSKVVGWYGATTSLFLTLSFLPALVGTVWLPRLVAAFTEGRGNLLKAARTPLEFILVVSVPIAAATAMAAGPLVHTIYGSAYGSAVPVMVILACIIPFGYLNIILVQVLIAEKRQALWTWVMIVAAVINPLMNLVLIPATQSRYHDGAIGAAISLLLTEGLMTVVGFLWVGRYVFDRLAIRRCLLAILASAAMLGVAYAARPLGTPASLAAGCATLALLIVVLRIPTPQEVALLRSGLARARRTGGALLARSG